MILHNILRIKTLPVLTLLSQHWKTNKIYFCLVWWDMWWLSP